MTTSTAVCVSLFSIHDVQEPMRFGQL